MAVALQVGSLVTFSGAFATLGTPSFRDLAVVVGAGGTNRAVFVIITGGADLLTNNWVVPTFNGTPMTLAGNGPSNGANSNSAMYYALAPSTGTFNVRISTSVHWGFTGTMTAFVLTGVHQSTPIGTPRNISNTAQGTPVSDTCTVQAGGMALHAFSTYNGGTTAAPAFAAGQTPLAGPVVRGNFDEGHDYKADATSMGFTMNAGLRQTSQLIVPVIPAPTPATTSLALITDPAVYAGSPGPGSSTQTSLGITTDPVVFSGASGTVLASLITSSFKNNTGTVLQNLTGLKVAVLRLSDLALVLNLANQTTDASGVLTIRTGYVVSGNQYLVVILNAPSVGTEIVTAVP